MELVCLSNDHNEGYPRTNNSYSLLLYIIISMLQRLPSLIILNIFSFNKILKMISCDIMKHGIGRFVRNIHRQLYYLKKRINKCEIWLI